MAIFRTVVSALLLGTLLSAAPAPAAPPDRVLIFTKTAGFRHDAIPTAVATLRTLVADAGMAADHTEDAKAFDAANLPRYRVVVFASTTGDVLDEALQAAMEGFVRSGGGSPKLRSGSTWRPACMRTGAVVRATHCTSKGGAVPAASRWCMRDAVVKTS